MEKLSAFVTQAREKGLSDESIRKNLELEGWEKEKIDTALVGIDVPKPDAPANISTHQAASPEAAPNQPFSLSPLMAALHHIILWFFVGSSTVTICGTVASLYGVNVSSNVLASMIAVTLITFVPYAVLFGIFLGKTRKNPLLVPGKIWSIITICLHSVGAMTAAIVLAINLILGGSQVFIISSALIFALDLLVVIAYLFAAFGIHRALKLRMVVISIYLPLLIIMFGILFTMSLMKLGPAKHDEDLRKDLGAVTAKIRTETRNNNKLPDSINGFTSNTAIRYEKTDAKAYKLCASFQTSDSNQTTSTSYYYSSGTAQENMSDAYVDDYSFYTSRTGENCFSFTSDYLTQKEQGQNPQDYSY
jgi:hypothetical protein